MGAQRESLVREHWRAGNMLYPIPAVMVTCQRPGEKPNIITVAWTGTVCSDPAMVYISVRPQRYSYDILRETGEFVINLTTEALADAADYCGVKSGRDEDKFAARHLTPIPSEKVAAPAIGESPVAIECRVQQVLPLGTHDMFLAEVLSVSVDARYIDEAGRLDLEKTEPLAYCHGAYYGLGDFIGSFGFSVRRKKKEDKSGKQGKLAGKRPQRRTEEAKREAFTGRGDKPATRGTRRTERKPSRRPGEKTRSNSAKTGLNSAKSGSNSAKSGVGAGRRKERLP